MEKEKHKNVKPVTMEKRNECTMDPDTEYDYTKFSYNENYDSYVDSLWRYPLYQQTFGGNDDM